MNIAVIAVFLDEEQHLPTFLESVLVQTRLPDRLVLVDDGSADRSPDIAAEFGRQHSFVRVLRRPVRARDTDRLATAPELRAFQWSVDQLEDDHDVVAKVDTDVRWTPHLMEEIEHRFAADPLLGIAGARLCEGGADGRLVPLLGRPEHVHGATKFYRRTCYDEILPIPLIHGWDMIDEVKARSRGWRTASFPIPGGDPVHLRPMGSQDGALRGFRRWGEGDYVAGTHPMTVLATGLHRLTQRPRVLGSLHYLYGWSSAGLRRVPRVDPEVRAFARAEQRERLRRRIAASLSARS